jgi:hypothetical protein
MERKLISGIVTWVKVQRMGQRGNGRGWAANQWDVPGVELSMEIKGFPQRSK